MRLLRYILLYMEKCRKSVVNFKKEGDYEEKMECACGIGDVCRYVA